jgi:type IX secretion system PorP/SprF family membrane protein
MRKSRSLRKRRASWLLACILFLVPCTLLGQDIHFSQFFQAPLLRNPALAGIFTGDIRVQAIYRDQWNSVTDAYRTTSLEGEYKMHIGKMDDYMTLGLQVLYDKSGSIGWTSANIFPALNYHKSLSSETNKYLSLAFMGGFVQNSFDRTRMTTNNTYDYGTDGENFSNTSYNYLDGSVGLSFNSNLNENKNDNYFVGVAYHHFNHPETSFFNNPNVQLPSKWVFSAGIRFDVTEFSYLTIQADHSEQGQYKETIAGAMYGLNLGASDNSQYTIHGGAFLRWNDAIIPTLKLDYSPFSVAFSYDVNISQLKPSSYGRGGFELSLSYIGFKQRNSATEALLCPRF